MTARDYDLDKSAADLGQAKATVQGTTIGTVKAGSRLCRVPEGVIVAHPDDKPYLLRWNGEREELNITQDGAIIMPPVAGIDGMTVNLSIASLFESVGFDRRWLTREQALIEDLRAAVQSRVNPDPGHLMALCRRALDVLEDLT